MLRRSYNGLSLIIDLNSDRLIAGGSLVVALMSAVWIASYLAQSAGQLPL
ncbi:MAG: hypothetical protein AAGF74_12665 [Pseudomonadota bacterium]